jgi:hypothetical protein
MKYLLDIQDNQSDFAEAFFKTLSFVKKVTPLHSKTDVADIEENDAEIISKISNSWSKKDVDEFKSATVLFETIEKELW